VDDVDEERGGGATRGKASAEAGGVTLHYIY
jgi:hypothetical protein